MPLMVQDLDRDISTEAVLIVENEEDVANDYREALNAHAVTTTIVSDVTAAWQFVSDFIAEDGRRLVILLDLMFEDDNPEVGCELMRRIGRLPAFLQGTIRVIVRSGVHDKRIKSQLNAYGVSAFHTKGVDSLPALQDVLLHLGKEVLTTSLLCEVVDVNDGAREIEVRYYTQDGDSVRCVLDSKVAPMIARVPGGSFWFDVYKKYSGADQEILRAVGRCVDIAEDGRILRDLFDDGVK